jgi:hypothetical protein
MRRTNVTLHSGFFLALLGVTLWKRGKGEREAEWKRTCALSDKLFKVWVSKHGFRTVSEERERERERARARARGRQGEYSVKARIPHGI